MIFVDVILPRVKLLALHPFDFPVCSVKGQSSSLPGLWYLWMSLSTIRTLLAFEPLEKSPPSLLALSLWEHESWGSIEHHT